MGASIAIKVDTSSLQGEFNKALKRTGDLTPLFVDIGEYMVEETKDNFHTGTAPDGTRWEKSQRAIETGDKTLIDRGHLRDSITKKTLADGVEVGTNVVYAAIHQFGGKTRPHTIEAKAGKALHFSMGGAMIHAKSVNHPGSKMPARPFLGVNSENMKGIKRRIVEHVLDKS